MIWKKPTSTAARSIAAAATVPSPVARKLLMSTTGMELDVVSMPQPYSSRRHGTIPPAMLNTTFTNICIEGTTGGGRMLVGE